MPNDARTVTEVECAYAAGFIDGEGCIAIARRVRWDNKRDAYVLRVSVRSTTRGPLDFLRERWGGGLCACGASGSGHSTCQVWDWQLHARWAARFLEAIYPYLILKKEQALFARAFQAMMEPRRGKRGFPEWFAMLEQCYLKLRALKLEGRQARAA